MRHTIQQGDTVLYTNKELSAIGRVLDVGTTHAKVLFDGSENPSGAEMIPLTKLTTLEHERNNHGLRLVPSKRGESFPAIP